MFKRVILSAFAIVGLLSAMSAISSDEIIKPTDLDATMHVEKIVLGSGCFWGAEKRYEALNGVLDAESGYADGQGFKPTYRNITKLSRRFDEDNYAEVVQVTFNSNIISARELLQNYYESHDPTQKNRQGNDVGTQYRSIILTTTDQQASIAKAVTSEYQQLLSKADYGKIVTQIKPLERFYSAEEYHQNYLEKNPNGYCPDHSTGVVFTQGDKPKVDNTALLNGKQIVILDSQSYCPYCEKFKAAVANDYKGTIPMTFRHADQLDGLTIKSATWATPTILFLENGVEVYSRQGYMNPEQFYKALGAFKLGNSEAYKVAFNAKTDSPYCKEYAIFKNTPDGIFIDKLSGEPLFDTRDRFNSGTGWLSFTHPIKDSVTQHEDNSWGMQRIELKSKSTGIHLGHLFPGEGPRGQDRYCINATVLEFVARKQ
ncbi:MULTISPECIES: peptide-methionine (S)-S-oxide reductase MsrA [Pseudoalteromonas]|jgi:peptide methionine sulfoxide reductase msrA/msrB|uniref:peptide-methionine (S)-S-oxide reductase MsrA n=1 Tax=Pseudoalteromonas TaxID=53246 RepID=UPI000563EEF8|nr:MULTISPECIES: peptide-methionine (S)-S-oxide reductase MsrA [Pseudoalteromonas]MAY58899.1 peptide-methionine (S)-S-oxide reductase [Pseudoalteromonas sp.]MDN3403842.1 peptide-methionine (S)-S-oxide reductase MsrA [Pseudoalteromonas sp. APC 3218]MDN3407634.1 peptide-methionine (S)-S-oxide reductase MsrA [Pseudoalteromonas sp. APC 3894]MDN3414945.1 peptide-methionine (S)-S-oxide reductase MsrA [Pseudoalteromonas sp. APC 3227]MDN3418643.1 peptide-methionine (S)-S-oxide reductase MsrA [Pseudoal|tara:strand:- start:317 stop:1603 length:1287 start_codon:yes stop_codon:yes gene_type:complete